MPYCSSSTFTRPRLSRTAAPNGYTPLVRVHPPQVFAKLQVLGARDIEAAAASRVSVLNDGTGADVARPSAGPDGIPRAAISAPHGAHHPRGRWLATANTNITAPADVPLHTSGHINTAQAAAQ